MRKKKSSRVIKIIGEISEESFKEFSDALDALEAASHEDIDVELHSGGGDAYAALAYCSKMRLSRCTFTVVAHGYVASAATLILAVGNSRIMAKEAWVMVHEENGKNSGPVAYRENEILHSRALETQWVALITPCTKLDAATWTKLHKDTTYLTAAECLAFGLVDEVI